LTDYILKVFKKQKTAVEEVSRVQELVQCKFADQIEPGTIKYAISKCITKKYDQDNDQEFTDLIGHNA
jgi:hypothetical protein